MPIWTRFIRWTTKTVLGETDVPVVMGGTRIASGDIVVLDADGGVTIPSSGPPRCWRRPKPDTSARPTYREKLLTGAMSYDLHGLRTYVEMNRRKQDAP